MSFKCLLNEIFKTRGAADAASSESPQKKKETPPTPQPFVCQGTAEEKNIPPFQSRAADLLLGVDKNPFGFWGDHISGVWIFGDLPEENDYIYPKRLLITMENHHRTIIAIWNIALC